jgi:hypothetical protein
MNKIVQERGVEFSLISYTKLTMDMFDETLYLVTIHFIELLVMECH